MNDTTRQIQQLIEDAVTKITALVQEDVRQNATAALESLFGESNGKAPRRARKATSGKRRGRPRKEASGDAEADAKTILTFLKANPESGRAAIQKETKLSNAAFAEAIAALGSKVKKKGEKRGRVYSAK